MNKILIFLQAYLLGRSGSRFVGLLLLLSLVWWAGPHVGLDGERLRLMVMGGILLFALGWWLVKLLLVRRRADRFKKELQSHDEKGMGRQLEIEELRTKMDEAIASLKSSELGVGYRGNAALYALPWFMIIGPSAAGKTTLLRNSGLHFPYAQGNDIDIKGFGGTRNCDWWFSNEAVLLDTAGRYTTEEDDQEEWSAFLAMLKKHRSRIPLNGVLVAVSLADLLTADEGGLEWHVKIIRDRIDELTTRLGCVFPIYLVLTKCDLLHGFESFFADLGDNDRNQVWGAWLAGRSADQELAEAFEEKMRLLYQRLCELRLRKLSMQRRFEAKSEIFDFAAQFRAASDKLIEFVNLLVQRNPYQETPRFCGVYFTSATQEGTPIQRILGNLRQAFGFVEDEVPRDAGTPKSYFIKKLFQEVIFPNALGVSRNRRSEVVHRWLKSAWVSACLAVIGASVLLLSTSLTSNTLLINQGSGRVADLRTAVVAEDPSALQVFEGLSGVYDHHQKLLDYERRLPWHLMLGVYHGDKQIAPALTTLLSSMEQACFRPMRTALEYRLENYARQWEASDDQGQENIRDPYYQALKVYLMLADPRRLEEPFALPVLVGLWKEQIQRGEPEKGFGAEQEAHFEALVRLYLNHLRLEPSEPLAMAAWQTRQAIVEKARKQLRTPPNAERLYAQLLSKAKLSLKDQKLEELIKGYSFGVLTSDYLLPGAYTEKGWREFIQPELEKAVASASRGDWVIGSYRGELAGADPARKGEAEAAAESSGEAEAEAEEGTIDGELARRLTGEVRRLYFADYADAWFRLLESVRISRFDSLEDAAKKMLIIARGDGPFGELLRVVSRNINLSDPLKVASLEASTQGIAGGENQPQVSLVRELDAPLRDLRKFTDPADKMTVSLLINQYLLAVSTMQGELERLSAAVDVQRQAKLYSATILTGGGANSELYKSWVSTSSLLNGIEARTRRIASRMLIAPIQNVWRVILAEARKDLQREWRASVLASFGGKLQGKFPFDPQGPDAALADVSDFFRPGDGVFWSFVHNQLAPFITEGRHSWSQKTWLDLGPGFEPGLLMSLSHARSISGSLFRRGNDEPDIRFSVYPLPTRGLSEMYFEANGQMYRYRNEPQEWRVFRWPGSAEKLGARVYGINGRGGAKAALDFEGVWGLFHILDKARVSAEEGAQYLSVWELQDAGQEPIQVQFRIKADRENNVFSQGLFSDFRVPETIF
ncbi:type VI secretion protein IcmF [Desulfuromonas versatilis]|uniref:Type VI secretion protein IcmF n=1 Tax=Desulfuromonas versatilis TaxID=2802975 RepID=A0ABN6DS23_9BACT|nr:type VI secretion system membrane subunit TssM [Desulfuromonas versatilis]BCR03015.1 type VI secretion protein IcmF [Desulfuromonas versatilis]